MRRRAYLGLLGTAALAGCTDEESGAEFLVTNTQLIHQSNPELNYPEDVLVRISIENNRPSEQEGTLEVTLEHDSGDEVDTWTKTDDVTVSQAAAIYPEYIFEDVYETRNDIDDYSLDAELTEK